MKEPGCFILYGWCAGDDDILKDALGIKRQIEELLQAEKFLLSKLAGSHAVLKPIEE